MPAMIFAQTDDWDGSAEIWTQGTGTESNPYLIESAENLAWISEMVNNGVTTYEGVCFKLTTNLDMQNIAWVPIGNSTTNLFCGKFDGDHHFIDNISITGSYTYAGLFGITGENVRIANLGVKSEIDINSSGSGYHGGIIGRLSGANTHIENCYNTGSVYSHLTNYSYAGGIVGYLDGPDARINNCYNTQIVSAHSSNSSYASYSGGIVGYCKLSLTVVDCYNTGNISSSGILSSGGIVGYCNSSLNVSNCYNTGDISSGKYSGGIVGYCYSTFTVVDCYNTGNISSSGTHSGGIVGYCESSLIVSNCYNTGDISSSGSTASSAADVTSYSGGIVGYGNSSLSLTSCHNIGTVSSTSSYTGTSASSSDQYINAYSGGMVGGGSSSLIVVTKCYNKGAISATAYSHSSSYNTSTSSINRQSNSGGLIGKGVARIFNSYNRGAVSAYAHYTIQYSSSQQTSYTSGTRQVGGLIGNVVSSSSTFVNSYNTGTLTGGSKGGIRGNTTGTVTNCYYLESCGGTVSGGTSKSEASMKSASFPILLNTDSVVFVMDVNPNVNDGYPIFGDLVCGVTTQEADNINFTSAKLNGFYTPNEYWPGGDADVIGFEYKLSTDANYTTVYTNVSTPASYNLHGLQLGSTYQYRMFVQKNGVTYYGNIVSFSTLSCDLQASVATSVSEMCDGSIATFTASCTSEHSDYFTYQWNNNVTGNILQVTDGETYTVTVQDTNGCSATASASVTVHSLPDGIISGQTSLCRGQSTTLTASGANRYNWSTGATSPTITVNESGTYTCTFTNVYNCSAARGVTVTVYDNPVITGETEFCAGGSTTLTAIGDGISYTWSTGETTPSITVTTPGTYSVTATFAGGCNCSSSSVTVVEHELPEVSISGTPIICSGIGAPLNVSAGSSYLWSTGETTQSITADHTGLFSVSVTDANGCTNDASVEVTELVGITISGNTEICQGETTSLSVEMEGEYVWSTGAQTPTITVSEAGPYSVTLSLPNGCSASATSNVIVNALPVPTISGITSICQGETTTLTANDGVSYHWSNNSTNASIIVGTAGMYTVTATNAQGCSATASTYLTVNALPTPTISGITTICQGETTTLTANGVLTPKSWTKKVQYETGKTFR